MSEDNVDEVRTSPASAVYWGLDPLFSINLKLFIVDVLNISCIKDCPNIYQYHGHVVYKVELMGDVVSIKQRNKHDILLLDDGTGRISCTVWKDKDTISKYKLGDLITVMGRIAPAYGDDGTRVIVQRLINDTFRPNSEHKRWKRVIQLKQQVYASKSYLKSFSTKISEVKNCQITVDSIKTMIRAPLYGEHHSKNSFSYTYNQIYECVLRTCNVQVTKHEVVQQNFDKALNEMVNSGELLVSNYNNSNQYQLIDYKGELAELILEIIDEKSTITLQQLCHLLHSTLTYAHLSQELILKALKHLEEKSFVYSPEFNLYKFVR